MWKKILIGLVILVALGAGGVWYLLSNLDGMVKAMIEKYGSEATRATVTVQSVHLSLTTGEGTITGLRIGNPAGFSTPAAFTLGSVTVKLDTASLPGTGPIVLRAVDIGGPKVTYEAATSGGSNLQAIQKNVLGYAHALGANAANAPTPSGEPARKIIIRDLNVHGGQVNVSATVLRGESLSAPLPDIHLTDIGRDEGATPAQIANQVIGTISREAMQTGATALKDFLRGAVTAAAKDVTGRAKGVTDRVGGIFGR